MLVNKQAYTGNEEGASAVEYALLAALIAAVIIAAVQLLGGNLSDVFDYIASKVTAPTT